MIITEIKEEISTLLKTAENKLCELKVEDKRFIAYPKLKVRYNRIIQIYKNEYLSVDDEHLADDIDEQMKMVILDVISTIDISIKTLKVLNQIKN